MHHTGMHHYPCHLDLHRLHLAARLGCEAAERVTPQTVEVDVRFYFTDLPDCAYTDGDDFICYDAIAGVIQGVVAAKEYRLIEHLGYSIYNALRAAQREDVKIWLRVHKVQIPVPFVLGGASFTYTDLPDGAA